MRRQAPEAPPAPALVGEAHGARIHHASWAQLAGLVEAEGGCDALIVDPPFSPRTHIGHEAGRLIAKRAASFAKQPPREGVDAKLDARLKRYAAKGRAERRGLPYDPWSDADMIVFLRRWVPLTRGWVCVLTDHWLSTIVEAELEALDRKTFPPLPCIDPGGRVRFSGDGPSSNTVWLVVARPRGMPWSKWGVRRGHYTPPPGYSERGAKLRDRLPGAKTSWLMQSIVDDYSRPGDLICDPCAGGGTTLRAAQSTGRRAVGADVDRGTAARAARLIAKPVQSLLIRPHKVKDPSPETPVQESLFK